jgi:hypothetical protein
MAPLARLPGLPAVTELLEGDILAGLKVPGDEQVVEHDPGDWR